jgi:energy-coupling factor transporter transmembrane protein EcfT
MQEHLSREAKKADATLTPTQLATRSSFSHDMKLQLLLLGFVVVVVVVVLSISDLFISFFLLSCC